MFYLNKFDTEQGLMVAVADKDLIGELFEENGVSLEVARDFYCGEIEDESAVEESLDEAVIANLVGENSIEIALNADIIERENILRVENIPHAQLVRI